MKSKYGTDYAQDSFRRLVLESLDKHTARFLRVNHHTYIAYILRNHMPKILCILLTGGAYAPDATCTPLVLSAKVPKCQKIKKVG